MGPLMSDQMEQPAKAPSAVRKRSVIVHGIKTSVSLEEPFWEALREIARARQTTISGLISSIDLKRGQSNLSSALRVFVLERFRAVGK